LKEFEAQPIMGEANSYKMKLIHVHIMTRSRLVQVVVNYRQAALASQRLQDCYIETGKGHEAKGRESGTRMMVMMMMMMMMMMTTTIIMMMVVVDMVLVIVTMTVTVRQEMPPQVHLQVTCQEGLRNNALAKCIWMLCKTSEISK
jgi:hypothetical protein